MTSLRKIHLHGALSDGRDPVYELDVRTPAEAARALSVQLPGFRADLEAMSLRIVAGADLEAIEITEDALCATLPDNATDVHFVPVVAGAKDEGIGKAILGTVLILASFAVPASWAFGKTAVSSIVGQFGASMLLGGIGMMMSKPTDTNYDDEGPTSEMFGGGANVARPGVAVPVIIGECVVGSVVVSAAIHNEDQVISDAE